MRSYAISFCLLLVALQAQPGRAQVPQTLSYQGSLTDARGGAATGDFEMTFRLYDAATGGLLLWEETQARSVPVTNGSFSVTLGSEIPIKIPFTGPLFLGIVVDGTEELSPRTPLAATAYSLHALTVADGSVSGSAIQDAQVVRSINGLEDDVSLQAGANISIVPNGNALLISATNVGGGGTVDVGEGPDRAERRQPESHRRIRW